MPITNVKCEIEVAPFTGNAYHLVSWEENGEYHSKSIHGCEDCQEAISEVLGWEVAESLES